MKFISSKTLAQKMHNVDIPSFPYDLAANRTPEEMNTIANHFIKRGYVNLKSNNKFSFGFRWIGTKSFHKNSYLLRIFAVDSQRKLIAYSDSKYILKEKNASLCYGHLPLPFKMSDQLTHLLKLAPLFQYEDAIYVQDYYRKRFKGIGRTLISLTAIILKYQGLTGYLRAEEISSNASYAFFESFKKLNPNDPGHLSLKPGSILPTIKIEQNRLVRF